MLKQRQVRTIFDQFARAVGAGRSPLAVLPLAALWNVVIYRIQSGVYRNEDLRVRRNPAGFLYSKSACKTSALCVKRDGR